MSTKKTNVKATAKRVSKITKAELKEYDDEKVIVIFKNNKDVDESGKLKTDKDYPHMRGSVTINGKKYWISLWKKVSQDGETYLRGNVQCEQNDDNALSDIDDMLADL
jgi:alpha-ketoglutarate-dependent taurine dioxygenase